MYTHINPSTAAHQNQIQKMIQAKQQLKLDEIALATQMTL